MGKTKRSCAEFIEAIEGSNGVKTIIARRLKVSRMTVDNYLDRWVTARRVYEQEVAAVSDIARSILIDNMKLQKQKQRQKNEPVSTSDAKWWLAKKESDEFNEKQRTEITGKDGEPLKVEFINDWRDIDN